MTDEAVTNDETCVRLGPATAADMARGGHAAQPESADADGCAACLAAAIARLREVLALARVTPSSACEMATALSADLASRAPQCHAAVRLLPVAEADLATHSINVCILSLMLAHALAWQGVDMVAMALGALLHDIGRVGHASDDAPGGAPQVGGSVAEHVEAGIEIGTGMGLPALALEIIAAHHECADGFGYPRALRVDQVSAPARLVALVDRFESLCWRPVDGEAWTPHEAMSTLLREELNGPDAGLLAAFVDTLGIYPLGSTVELTDGRHGLVVRSQREGHRTVRVRVLDHRHPQDDADVVDIGLGGAQGIRRALTLRQMPPPIRRLIPRHRSWAYFWDLSSA